MAPANWIEQLIPIDTLVPEAYREWRPLVRDSMRFVVTRMSTARLETKIFEQAQLPVSSPPEARLISLIRKMPGLQKLGQVLARNRHLDPSLRRELLTLENGIRDVTFEEIRAVIESELGPALANLDVRIEPRIFSEASVSAVVRFSFGNTNGIFKVLKPHIHECFSEDMRLLQELADFIASGSQDYGFDAQSSVAEIFSDIRRLLEHEVNFEFERANLVEGAKVFERVPGIRVPRLIPELCTSRITAMTEESGIKATDLSQVPGYTRRTIARRLAQALLVTPLLSRSENALFHADPHAGNLFYDSARDKLIILDWALTGRLSLDQRRQFCLLLMMLVLRDTEGVIAAIRQLGEGDAGRIRKTVESFIQQLPFTRVPGSVDALRLLDSLGLEGVRFPAQLLMFRKVLFTLDGVLRDVAGEEFGLDSAFAGAGLSLPLGPADWAAVLASASFYGNRLWMQLLTGYTPSATEYLHKLSSVKSA